MLAAVCPLPAQMAAGASDPNAPIFKNPDRLRYTVEEGYVVGRNGPFFNNRPLYCPHGPAAALAGDRPLIRFLEDQYVFGTFSVALIREGKGKWLQDAVSAVLEYRCGRAKWRIADPTWPGVEILLDAVPLENAPGFAARLAVKNARPGDRVVWAFGGAHPQQNAMWAFDPVLLDQNQAWSGQLSRILRRGAEPEQCRGNRVTVTGGAFQLTPPGGGPTIRGTASAGSLLVADGGQYGDPAAFAESRAKDLPIAAGVIPIERGEKEIFFAVGRTPQPAPPRSAFLAGVKYMQAIESRVVIRTPDSYLDAAVNAVNHSLDAVFYPPVFRHGCMAWNVPFPGWRTMFGATAFGWHGRVLEQAKYYIASQVKDSPNAAADPDPAVRLTHESKKSRFWGAGKITQDAGMYNFQSQFFDQLIHSWRWTGDPQLERVLRPALELHAGWIKDNFDPDGDGLYESYINVWPTDTVWYNGGGSVEESSYAYTVHRALADMARRAGDSSSAERHSSHAARIRKALFDVLWVAEKGHFAAYQEQGGRRRVHGDAWLYSQFLPIDAKLTTFEESLGALYYSEWALENVRPRLGGRRVWTSNWVPSKWSVRELYAGDNYHLGLAYFQTGLGEEGYDLVKGNTLELAFATVVPGAQAQPEGGTDFNDLISMFGRVIVEGLFGFEPDYPNGKVSIRPAFPADWPRASITTPDFSLSYARSGMSDRYQVTLARPAALAFRLPVRATGVNRVLVNGRAAEWKAEPGPGCTLLRLTAPETSKAEVVIELASRAPAAAPQTVSEASPRLKVQKVRTGELEQYQLIKARVLTPDAAPAAPAPQDARWECLDLASTYNGDIRAIFKQRYLSPRPKTASVRIGVDGYSPWTFPYWKIDPPEIDLSEVPASGRLLTPQNVPFTRLGAERNVAFASLWDNWPDAVAVPVGRAAEAAWVLVAGSTNPMQTRIANAELRFRYADGEVERLELVPPFNFWSLCPLGDRDYSYERDAFALPRHPPPTVQLGKNCRAMVLAHRLRRGVKLEEITLEALSQEVVIGLMGVSLMNPAP